MQGAKALAAVFAKEKSAGLFYQGADGKYIPVEDPDTPKSSAVPLVNTDEKKEVMKPQSVLAGPSAGSVMAMMLRGKKGGKAKGPKSIFRFNTAIRTSATGGSGTFLGTVFNLNPNGTAVTEAIGLAALFDEARCVGITFHLRVIGNIVSSANNAAWAVVYDSANSGAYTSVIGTLVAAQHFGPVLINDTPNASSVVAQTKTGFELFRVKVPPNAPTAGSGVASESVGNNWFSTQDINANVGFLKWAVDVSTGIAYTVEAFIVYHMEYRMRT